MRKLREQVSDLRADDGSKPDDDPERKEHGRDDCGDPRDSDAAQPIGQGSENKREERSKCNRNEHFAGHIERPDNNGCGDHPSRPGDLLAVALPVDRVVRGALRLSF